MLNSSGFLWLLSCVSSRPSGRLRLMPPRELLEAGRSLLSTRGEGCGLTRGGRGVRDRVDSTLGLGDLLGPALEGLTPEILLATD